MRISFFTTGATWLALTLLAGCSTGLHRDALDERLAAGYPAPPSPEAKSLAVPFKLAVALRMERRRDGEFIPPARLNWNRQDQERLVAYLQDCLRLKAISEHFFLPADLPDNPEALSEAATTQGAEALLTLRGITEVDWYCNPAALLDPTIIGAMWIPGGNRDVMVSLRADLFDLRGERDLIWTGTASETRYITGPNLVIDTRDAANPARRTALRRVLEGFYLYLRRQTPLG